MKKLGAFLMLIWGQSLFAGDFDCSNWPKNMAFGLLKNHSLINSNLIDHDKTEARLLKSDPIGDNLYREMYLIKYFNKSGNIIEVITISDASSEECSMSEVDVYLKLGEI